MSSPYASTGGVSGRRRRRRKPWDPPSSGAEPSAGAFQPLHNLTLSSSSSPSMAQGDQLGASDHRSMGDITGAVSIPIDPGLGGGGASNTAEQEPGAGFHRLPGRAVATAAAAAAEDTAAAAAAVAAPGGGQDTAVPDGQWVKFKRWWRTSETPHQLGVTFCNMLGILALISLTALLYMYRQGYDPSHPQRTLPFSGSSSITDGFYWCSTTISSIGFGDIVPQNLEGMLGTCLLIITGLPILTYVCQTISEFCTDWEQSLITRLYEKWPQSCFVILLRGSQYNIRGQRVDIQLHRIKVRWFLSAFYYVVWMLAGVGIFALQKGMSLGEAIYATVIAQTTVGYGDKPFRTKAGKMLASVWMIIAPATLNRMFEVQIEARLHLRSKRILSRELTRPELEAAGFHYDRELSKLDFVIHKLKIANKTDDTDIIEIRRQYEKLIQAQLILKPIRLQWTRDCLQGRGLSCSVSNSSVTTWAERAIMLNEEEEEMRPPATTSEVSHQLGVTFCNVLGILALVSFTAVLYMWRQGYDQSNPRRTLPFNGSSSITDGFYWCTTTISSIGFGDVIPQNLEGKLGTCLLTIIGLPVLTYVCQTLNEFCTHCEESLISWLYANWPQNCIVRRLHGSNYTKRGLRVDTRLHQIKVRWFLSVFYSISWMLAGVYIFASKDHMSLGQAFYATVISQSTVGYGDKPFRTDAAKMLASFWMIMAPSTLNRVFEVQVEARLHMRSKRILFRELTVPEIQAANNLSELNFIIHKLNLASKTDDEDIMEINRQYRRLIQVQNNMQPIRYIWSYKSPVKGQEHV